MIFNFTHDYKFTTDISLNNKLIDVEKDTRLLGTIISDTLTWDKNIENIVRKSNSRMQLLHKISKFGASIEDMKIIYFSYIRSILEQSSNVWHTSLSQENEQNLERIQKSCLKLILKSKYETYEKACNLLEIDDLKTSKQKLFEKFTVNNLNNPHFKNYFIKNKKDYNLRNPEKFKVTQANTERFKKSTVIEMQKVLNKLHKEGKILMK